MESSDYQLMYTMLLCCLRTKPTSYDIEKYYEIFVSKHMRNIKSFKKWLLSEKKFEDNYITNKVEHDITVRTSNNKYCSNYDAVIAINSNKQILTFSNFFLLKDRLISNLFTNYNMDFNIYKNITNNYDAILDTIDQCKIIEEPSVYMCNSYMNNNTIECFGQLCSIIENIIESNDTSKKIVITDDTLKNIIKILYIFFDEDQLIRIDSGTNYQFKEILFLKPTKISHNSLIISKIINFCDEYYVNKNKGKMNNKILLINNRCIINNLLKKRYLDKISQKCDDLSIINESEYTDIYELIYQLHNAQMIITEPKTNLFEYIKYFSKNAKIYIIGKSPNETILSSNNIEYTNLKNYVDVLDIV